MSVACDDALNARTASGVKSGIPVEGRAAVVYGCRGKVTGGVRRGLADGDADGRGCGVADDGGASTDLADGGRGRGWDCPVGEGCLGHDSSTSGRDVGATGRPLPQWLQRRLWGRGRPSSGSGLLARWCRGLAASPRRNWLR